MILVHDFFDEKLVYPLYNADGNGFGVYFNLVVGAGNHTKVTSDAIPDKGDISS